jgi:hypothetical protein
MRIQKWHAGDERLIDASEPAEYAFVLDQVGIDR